MASPGHRGRPRRARLRIAVALSAPFILLAVLVPFGLMEQPSRAGASTATTAAPPDRSEFTATRVGSRWLGVLSAIDRRRAAAWRSGDPSGLLRVYAPGSCELAADRRLLEDYVARG